MKTWVHCFGTESICDVSHVTLKLPFNIGVRGILASENGVGFALRPPAALIVACEPEV